MFPIVLLIVLLGLLRLIVLSLNRTVALVVTFGWTNINFEFSVVSEVVKLVELWVRRAIIFALMYRT